MNAPWDEISYIFERIQDKIQYADFHAKPQIFYRLIIDGCEEERFSTLEEAKKEMEERGFIALEWSVTFDAGRDENGKPVCENGYYYGREDDLPENWRERDVVELIDELQGDEECLIMPETRRGKEKNAAFSPS